MTDEPKLYTQRELVQAQRDAAVNGLMMYGVEIFADFAKYTGAPYVEAYRRIKAKYPLPPVTRPRKKVLCGWEYFIRDGELHMQAGSTITTPAFTCADILALADLIANPTEPVTSDE